MAKRSTVFHNGSIILPDRVIDGGVLICRDGRITGVGNNLLWPKRARTIDARKGFIAPGYVDIHVHGGDGADFMDGTAEAVRTANRAHARHATTTIFPTTTTGSVQQVEP